MICIGLYLCWRGIDLSAQKLISELPSLGAIMDFAVIV